MRGETGPDFIEALARGLDVIRAFGPNRPIMTLSEVATAAGLARPTARRMLLTLEELGYVRTAQGGFALTPRVLELGMAYIGSTSIWDIARPHMEQLVGCTNESSSLAQLDGSDIVYVARVAVPKIITIAVTIGTRFPALQTSLGKVLLADRTPDELEQGARRAKPLRHHAALATRQRKSVTVLCTRCEQEDGRSPMNIWPMVFARLPHLCAMEQTVWSPPST